MKKPSANQGESTPQPDAAPAGLLGKFRRLFSRQSDGGKQGGIRETTLILGISLFMALAYNAVFFAKVLAIYPPGFHYLLFHLGIFVIMVALTAFLFSLVSSKYTTKPIAIVLVITSSLVCYFVNTYRIVVDDDMLRNVIQTDVAESRDLMSLKMMVYLLFLGVLPSVIIWRLPVIYRGFIRTLLGKLILAVCCLALIAASVFSSASTFASFLREHKSVRAYVNPAGYIYAVGKLIGAHQIKSDGVVQPYAEDASVLPHKQHRRLVIMVVGETARADHFSLNGYARETNPLLKREDIVNFSNVMAAGTSTAVSVPSMFSHLDRKHYNAHEARYTENALDILARVGVSVLWRDNNSDSKGVALRVAYEDYKNPDLNPICDIECRDEGMLVNLQDYIDRQPGDVFIVLHSMGNHGPAYYKRYPKEFEVFKPVCRSNQLEKCSPEEINNAYDNAILYTDYFLSKVIALLKRNDSGFETAMLYFSDHGESLGENNMYLHGYPYAFAPIEQKHIPAVFWFGSHFPIDRDKIRANSGDPYSHDNIFSTLLGLFEVKTKVYQRQMDMVTPYLTGKP